MWTKDGKLLIGYEGKLMMFDRSKPENGGQNLQTSVSLLGIFTELQSVNKELNWHWLPYTKEDKKQDATKR